MDVSPRDDGNTVDVDGTLMSQYPQTFKIDKDQSVTLEALPASGYEFTGWSGDLKDDANPAQLVMTCPKKVTANFSKAPVSEPPPSYYLRIKIAGSGNTTPMEGKHNYDEGTEVSILATPNSGWQFDGWVGDVADRGKATSTITMDSYKTVTAEFSPVTHTLVLKEDDDDAVAAGGVAELTWEGNMLSVRLAESGTALDAKGKPLSAIDIRPVEPNLKRPADRYIVGPRFDLLPWGATFDPPLKIIVGYDPTSLPRGITEEDLSVVRYNHEAGIWVKLLSQVDTVDQTIAASVSHSSTLAVIGLPPMEPIKPAATPPAVPATKPPVPEDSPSFNWPLLGSILGSAVVLGLLTFTLISRR
ncbi:hypothetical protein ACFLVF_01820 [Chloroflexota bacterium]